MNGVTLVTLTEFGRRVGENGSGGVDHGFGQAVLLLGGGVVGGQVHGDVAGPGGGRPRSTATSTVTTTTARSSPRSSRSGAGRLGVPTCSPGLGSDRPGVVNQKV